MKKSHVKLVNKKKVLKNSFLILISLLIITLVAFKTISYALKHFNGNYSISTDEKKEINHNNTSNNSKSAVASPLAKNTNTEVLLSATGYCTIGTDSKFAYANSLPAMALKPNKDFSYYFKNVYSILSKDDVTIANLETTFTDSNDK